MTRREHYPALDGLRGVAALAVVLYHLGWQTGLESSLVPHGYLAVDFFFILSGFVVASAYEARLGASMTILEFSKIRLIRLYPMIFLGTLLGITIIIAKANRHPGGNDPVVIALQFVASLLLIPVWFPIDGTKPFFSYPVDAPLWSLFLEVLANAVYASGVRLAVQRYWSFVVIFSMFALIIISTGHDGINVGDRFGLLEGGFARVGCSFFVGVLLWRVRHLFPSVRINLGVLAAILMAMFLIPIPADMNWAIDCAAVLIIFPIIVVVGTSVTMSLTVKRCCIWAGQVSYPLYVLHDSIVLACIPVFNKLHVSWKLALGFDVLCALACILAAHLAWRWFDRPMRNALQYWIGTKLPPTPASTVP